VADNIDETDPEINFGDPAYYYFDVIRTWLKTPMTVRQVKQLEGLCEGGLRDVYSGEARFDPQYRQRATLLQPTHAALEFLCRAKGTMINYIEIAHDIICNGPLAVFRLTYVFNEHFVQRWHGKRKNDYYSFSGGTTRKAPEKDESRRGHWFQWYSDEPSRKTGEVSCFHIEGRHQGVHELRRIGITEPRDLLSFDHVTYWQRRMRLRAVDLPTLGRWYSNKENATRKHKVDNDVELGQQVYRQYGTHPIAGTCAYKS
jgi:hypothetical protein